MPGGMFRPAGGGMFNIGQPGALRLITGSLSKEASWLLPLALFGLLTLVGLGKLSWPLDARRQAAVLWGGWLLTAGIFFSVAGFFHEYYLAMLGAPMAALVGIGVLDLWKLLKSKTWLGLAVLLLLVGMTLGLQFNIAKMSLATIDWQGWVLALAVLGGIAAGVALKTRKTVLLKAGFVLMVVSLFITPLIWSIYTMKYSSVNQSLPAAFSGNARELQNSGGLQVNQELLEYLEDNTQGVEYLMAVPSSMQGADYVLATGRPVLYMGGFNGSDEVVSADDLEYLVESGRLRFIYYGSGGGNPQGQNNVYAWVTENCRVVSGFDTQTANAGNPDGTGGAPGGMGPAGGPGLVGQGNMRIALYDCSQQTTS